MENPPKDSSVIALFPHRVSFGYQGDNTNEMILRSRGIVSVIRAGALAEAMFDPDDLAAALDQVDDNLRGLEEKICNS